MKKMVLATALVVLALAPALLMAYPAVGSPAPNFTLPDTALVNHSLSDYLGKCVQLQFWDSG